MSKTAAYALTALLAAFVGLILGLLLNRNLTTTEPPADDLNAALLQFQETADIAARHQDQKLQTALDKFNRADQSIQNLTDQVAALSQQNQNLIQQLLQLRAEFAEPNTPQTVLADNRIPVTFESKPVVSPTTAETKQVNTGQLNKNIDEIIVFVTKTGKKYHRPDCPSLTHSKIRLTLTEAIARGYTPCTRCKPPGS